MISSHPVSQTFFEPVLPGDKSITHRAFLLSLLSRGSYRVEGGNTGQDCLHTLKAVEALGVEVTRERGGLRFKGAEGSLTAPRSALDLGNSGTGLRLLLGVLAGQPFKVSLTGDHSLQRRPMGRVLDPLGRMGVWTEGRTPPVSIQGGTLAPLEYTLPVASAQVKSALLLASLQAEGKSVIRGKIHTRDHTERMLTFFGVPLHVSDQEISLTGPCIPEAKDLVVPGDPSAAAFYSALPGIVPGSSARLSQVSLNPGRIAFLDCLRRMGFEITVRQEERCAELRGDVHVQGNGGHPLEVAPEEVPHIIDELPILVVVASFAKGTSTFRGLAELKIKESNRLEAMQEGLTALGADIRIEQDSWIVRGSGGMPLPGGRARSRGDHRVAMALLMAGLHCASGATVQDPPGIETSDPHFLENLGRLQETGL